jgi:hypothetical protein
MIATRFKVGDRIRARVSVHNMAQGTLGTIRRVSTSIDNLYDVRFDGQSHLYAVRGTELERAADKPEVHPGVFQSYHR